MLHVGLWKHNQTGYWHLDIPPNLSPTQKRWRPSTGQRDKRIAERFRAKAEEGKIAELLGLPSMKSRTAFESDYLDH
ncbi:hypothetical protein ACFL44_03605, partial [Gemmatimonadota bacterium]